MRWTNGSLFSPIIVLSLSLSALIQSATIMTPGPLTRDFWKGFMIISAMCALARLMLNSFDEASSTHLP